MVCYFLGFLGRVVLYETPVPDAPLDLCPTARRQSREK